MLPESVKIKVSPGALGVLDKYLSIAATMSNVVRFESHRLLYCLIAQTYRRVAAKNILPKKVNTITLSVPEALAFYLVFSKEDFSHDTYAESVMIQICSQIHQKCCV